MTLLFGSSCRFGKIENYLIRDESSFELSTTQNIVNLNNQNAFPVSGTCIRAGANKVSISISGTVLTTVDCMEGAPKTWSAVLDFTSLSTGNHTLELSHETDVGITKTITFNITKDLSVSLLSITYPAAGVCISPSTSNSFSIEGECNSGGGPVSITSAQLSTPVSISCTGNTFSATLNVSTSGLSDRSNFVINVGQVGPSGVPSNANRTFRFISTPPTVSFQGWDDVYAVGKKTYYDGNSAENGVIRIKWKEWSGPNTCVPNFVKVFRSNSSGTSLSSGIEVTSGTGVRSTESTFQDASLLDADFEKAWYYGLKAVVAGVEYNITTPAQMSEIRVIAPPANMSLVHRWIANQDVCGHLNQTSDPLNNYRCPFGGQGKVTISGSDYHDMGNDVLVDRFELGCRITANCGAGGNTLCLSENFSQLKDPASGSGVIAPIGAVYFYNGPVAESGGCHTKTGAGNTNWTSINNASGPQISGKITSEAHAPPLANVTRAKAHLACQQQSFSLSQVTPYADNTTDTFPLAKRLMRLKEWRAAASWNRNMSFNQDVYSDIDQWILYLEADSSLAGDLSGKLGKCFASGGKKNSLSLSDRQFLLGFEPASTFETGSKISTNLCQSRYGIQDMVGNVQEWVSDHVTCSSSQGDTCVGVVNTLDADNTEMVGFAFDGFQGPGNRTYAGDPTWTTNTWEIDSVNRNGTTYFNPLLGLPLMANDLGGSIFIDDWKNENLFHRDRISMSSLSAGSKGLYVGGAYFNGTVSGRWYSHLTNITSTANHMGARCGVSVR